MVGEFRNIVENDGGASIDVALESGLTDRLLAEAAAAIAEGRPPRDVAGRVTIGHTQWPIKICWIRASAFVDPIKDEDDARIDGEFTDAPPRRRGLTFEAFHREIVRRICRVAGAPRLNRSQRRPHFARNFRVELVVGPCARA